MKNLEGEEQKMVNEICVQMGIRTMEKKLDKSN